jgi:hypothetical protein
MSSEHKGLILTEGVQENGGMFVFEALGCAISAEEDDYVSILLATGFASEPTRFSVAWIDYLLHSRSRASLLRTSMVQAILHSIRHNALGMARWWVVIVLCGSVGALAGLPSLAAIAVAAALFLVSILVHEAGHVAAYRHVAGARAAAVVVSAGARCFLIRPVLSGRAERWVVISGPVAPLLVAIALIPLSPLAAPLFWSWLAIALGHALLLAFPVGDGVNLRLTFRRAARNAES